jgi:hypothetical protein
MASYRRISYTRAMRREPHAAAIAQNATPLERVEAMMREGLGLELLRQQLGPGATLDDARRTRERILQLGRRPSRLLDEALGIERA